MVHSGAPSMMQGSDTVKSSQVAAVNRILKTIEPSSNWLTVTSGVVGFAQTLPIV